MDPRLFLPFSSARPSSHRNRQKPMAVTTCEWLSEFYPAGRGGSWSPCFNFLFLDLAGKPMAFWNLFPRKALTQGWAWSDWCLCCRIRCPTMTLTSSSLILKPSRRYWSYCGLLWRFPGWLLVLSKIKQLYALPCEGTCDHLPASLLILITQCSEEAQALWFIECRGLVRGSSLLPLSPFLGLQDLARCSPFLLTRSSAPPQVLWNLLGWGSTRRAASQWAASWFLSAGHRCSAVYWESGCRGCWRDWHGLPGAGWPRSDHHCGPGRWRPTWQHGAGVSALHMAQR